MKLTAVSGRKSSEYRQCEKPGRTETTVIMSLLHAWPSAYVIQVKRAQQFCDIGGDQTPRLRSKPRSHRLTVTRSRFQCRLFLLHVEAGRAARTRDGPRSVQGRDEWVAGWTDGRTDGRVGRREKSLSTVCAGAVSASSPSTTRWASNRRPDSGATGGCRGGVPPSKE